MKSTIKVSVLASAVLALASVAAYGGPEASTTISLSATVVTDDAVTCTVSDPVNFGSSLVQGTTSAAQLITCNVTDNDTGGVDMYVYGTIALTSSNTNTIPLTDLQFEAVGGSSYTAFTDVSAGTGVTGAIGGKVYSGLAEGLNATAENVNLELNVPANQPADVYSTTLTVGIVPAAS